MNRNSLLVFLLFISTTSWSQIDTLSVVDTLSRYRETARAIDALNSDAVDYAPAISADGKTMIIESNRSGRYILYQSELEGNQWSEPKPIDNINNYGNSTDLIGGPSLSFDGNTLYFFASFLEGLGSEDIYYSVREGDSWSEPKNIGAPINSTGYEGFPSISADGSTLYFVKQTFDKERDKEFKKAYGEIACFNIFQSKRNPEGTWSTPTKLPFPVNDVCEKAPRIMADNRTLIFASNRPGGAGDFDLYQTQLNAIGDWERPVPLTFINSPRADQFTSITAEGDQLYYVFDAKDIYSVEIPPSLQQFKNNIIQGSIKDGDSGEGIGAEITVSDAFTSQEVAKLNNNPDNGQYSMVLATGRNYNIEIKKEGYSSQTFSYDLTGEANYQEINQDVVLFPSAKLSLNIYDIDIFEPLSTQVVVKEKSSGSTIHTTQSSGNGRLLLDLSLGEAYEVSISKTNFKTQTFEFDVSGFVVYRDFERDIELIPLKKDVEIRITDLVNRGRVRSRVRIRNTKRDEVINSNGNETVALRIGDRYEIEATSDQGYAFNSTVLDVNDESTLAIELKLQPLVVGADLTLKDILFETNSDQLNEISYKELQRVITLMLENGTLKVEIDAHTDDVGSATYNQALSERRAQSVVQFLIEQRVKPDRFVAKGYGESNPVVPNDTEENRAKNRRVVLKILAI